MVEEKQNLSIVDEARKLRDEIRAENDRRESILRQEEKLKAETMLSSSAGQPQEIKPAPVETAKEYADRVMRNKL